MPGKHADPATRFWRHVDTSGECWMWTGGRSRKGYGELSIGRRNLQTHRFAWELMHGAIPPGKQVLHDCDTPACVNPAHLRLGTNADNMADRNAKGRTACGERSGTAKLSTDAVAAIRARLAAGETGRALAREYGVTDATIVAIRHNRTWKHVNP